MYIPEKNSIIVVGSGTSLLDQKNGEIIDSYNDVVRFNTFYTEGYEEYVGTKTTIWYNVNPYFKKESVEYKRIYLHSWDEDNKCPVYQKYKHLKNAEKVPFKLVQKIIKDLNNPSPSTGLIAVIQLLQTYTRLTLTGFDWWDRKEHHYFGKDHYRGPNHNPQSEKEVLLELEKENRIDFL